MGLSRSDNGLRVFITVHFVCVHSMYVKQELRSVRYKKKTCRLDINKMGYLSDYQLHVDVKNEFRGLKI